MVHMSPPGIQDAYSRLLAQGLSDYTCSKPTALSIVRSTVPSTGA
jgi:hypothetical protein